MENNDPNFQLSFAFIDRQIDNNIIKQRLLDGYINGTAICKSAGKEMKHYLANQSTKEYINQLSSEVGIPTSDVIQIVKGGTPEFQGTWVHPYVATHLAQWANAKLAVKVNIWITEWINGNIQSKGNLPYHLKRYILNRRKIPNGYFSVFNEIVYSLIAPLEDAGYTLPDKLVPDISEGKVFCNWLRKEKGIDPSTFPTYQHEYTDGRIVYAKLYPNSLLPDFRAHFSSIWLLEKAYNYFSKKDKEALPFVEQMMLELPKAEQIKLQPNKEESLNDDPTKA